MELWLLTQQATFVSHILQAIYMPLMIKSLVILFLEYVSILIRAIQNVN